MRRSIFTYFGEVVQNGVVSVMEFMCSSFMQLPASDDRAVLKSTKLGADLNKVTRGNKSSKGT